VETGKGAHGVAIDEADKYAYITNLYGNDITIFDLTLMKVIARVAVGDTPNGISVSPLSPTTPPSPSVKLEMPEGSDMESGDGEMHP